MPCVMNHVSGAPVTHGGKTEALLEAVRTAREGDPDTGFRAWPKIFKEFFLDDADRADDLIFFVRRG